MLPLLCLPTREVIVYVALALLDVSQPQIKAFQQVLVVLAQGLRRDQLCVEISYL